MFWCLEELAQHLFPNSLEEVMENINGLAVSPMEIWYLEQTRVAFAAQV